MKETLFDEIYEINKELFGCGRMLTKSERFAAVEKKKDFLNYAAEHNPLVNRVLTTNATFVSLYEDLKMNSGGRVLLPGRFGQDDETNRNISNLSQLIRNTGHLKRHSPFYPDNVSTDAAYGALTGIAGSVGYFNNLNWGAIALGLATGGIAGAAVAITNRNRTILDFTSSQDVMAPKPWHALQILDLERAFYMNRDNTHWAYMELNPIDITKGMSGPERDALSDNKLLVNEGITYFYKDSTLFDRIPRLWGRHVSYESEFAEYEMA